MTALRRIRPLSIGVEVALAFAAGVASFALASVFLLTNDSDAVAAVLAVLAVLGVIAVLRYWGVTFAVPAAVAILLSYDWYFVPPTHLHAFPNAADLGYLLPYISTGVLIGELTPHAGKRADTSE